MQGRRNRIRETGQEGAAPSQTAVGSAVVTPFKPVETRRLYEQIAEQIELLIQEGIFKTGDKLPAERDLARMLNVSRPSIREAMIALETAGLIEVRTGDGTYVRAAPPKDRKYPWAIGDDDPGPGPLEQFEARQLIEPELAAVAARMITEGELAELETLVEKTAEPAYMLAGSNSRDQLGKMFHVTLARAARNRILANLVEELWEMREGEMWRTVRARVVKPEHRIQVLKDRRELVAALRRHDSVSAREAMTVFLQRARKRYFDE